MPHEPTRCRLTVLHGDFILQNHRVHGTSVLPGVTFIDILLRIVAARGGDPARTLLRDVLFLEPVATTGELDREVLVTIEHSEVAVDSRPLRGGVAAGAWTRNLTASIADEPPGGQQRLDVAALKAAATSVRDMDEIYEQARGEEIVHGAPMRCTGRLHESGEDLLAELELDRSSTSQEHRFQVHPAALDASTLVAFARTPPLDAPFIPISLASARVTRPLRGRFYVHVARRESIAASGDAMHNSYTIHDDDGALVAELARLTCKRIRFPRLITNLVADGATVGGAAQYAEHLRRAVARVLGRDPQRVSTTDGFYEQGLDSVAMLQISRDLESIAGSQLYPTLLFEFRNIETLARHLADNYAISPSAAQVKAGARLCAFRTAWHRRPAPVAAVTRDLALLSDDVATRDALANALRAQGHRVATAADEHDTIVLVPADRARAYEEAQALATAVIQRRPASTVCILFAGVFSPELAALGAFARTVTAETPLLRCRALVVENGADLAMAITRELAADDDEPLVRARPGVREVPRLEPLPLADGATPLKTGGVYLVTGGGGGVGRKLATYLARRRARLLLIGRREAGVELVSQIRAWRETGAEAEYMRADVANLADVESAVARAKELYGGLDGVFHLAGEVHDAVFFRKDASQREAVLAPKIRGAMNLDRATRDDRLDLFVLFSSVSAVVANAGQSDYAYANSVLDHFAAWRQSARGGTTISIAWPYWADGAMKIADAAIARDRQTTGAEPLPSSVALDALDSLLASGAPHVVVAYGDIARIHDSLPVETPEAPASDPAEPRIGDIAIIGVAGRYPDAPDVATFWKNLAAGHDAIREVPVDRWDHEQYVGATRGKTKGRWGGFIDGVDRFAPAFFSISRRDAERMDPQERLFLQTAWHALEDAGYTPESLAAERVGVFAGAMWSHYQLLDDDGVAPTALHSSIPNRVSYAFGLKGPSIAVDTACSSSLVALHMAVESIRNGDATMALAGGVNVTVHPQKYLQLARDQFLSDDGRCRAFGSGGTGYVPGEGVGVLVLKPLTRALADGDHVEAVIKGSAVNHSGRTSGYTVPDPNAQAELVREAIRRAGVPPASITYIEAHGTGTALGDPIEIEGLRKAFADAGLAVASCAIGSVKSNIGHLESAAGVAAVTKVLLQMRHGELAPSLHADVLNEHIDFASSPFAVQRQRARWHPQDGMPLRAGVSGFGAGGANAHVVLESTPPLAARTLPDGPQLVVLSAPRADLLKALARSLVDALSAPLADIAYTLQVGRRALECRVAFVVEDVDALRRALRRFVDGGHAAFAGEFDGDARLDDECVKLFRRGDLDEVARRWVNGARIDWLACHAGARLRRVSLPVTPLPEERCWIGEWKRNPIREAPAPDLPAPAAPAATSTNASVQCRIVDSGIAIVTMRDDAHRNIFTDELLRGLEESFGALASNRDVRVVVLAGSRDVFCMGGAPDTLETLAAKRGSFTDAAFVYEGLLRCDSPVVAAIQGHAAGGGLAFGLYADVVVMSREASYAANFLKYGFTPGMGASHILEHRFGAALAAEMLLTGRSYGGNELERRGAQVLFDAGEAVLPRAMAIARSIAAMPTRALRVLKSELARRTLDVLKSIIPAEAGMHERVLGGEAVEIVRERLAPRVAESAERERRDAQRRPGGAASEAHVQEPRIDLSSVDDAVPDGADRKAIVSTIEASLCAALYLRPDEINHERTFSDMGADSITAVEIVRDLNRAFGTDLDSVAVYDHPTVSALTERVVAVRGEQRALHDAAVAPPASQPQRQPFRVVLEPVGGSGPDHAFEPERPSDIAVVGMSGRFPDAPDVETMWRNLASGVRSIREVSADRWDVGAVFDPDPNAEGKTYSRWTAMLGEVDDFDHRFFHLSPREAEEMDPQQRLFLTEAWKALEHAGYAGSAGEGQRCGIFVGCTHGDYLTLLDDAGRRDTAQAFLGNSSSILAARVAYFLDFHGPAVAIDTACSSSLIAVHLACQSLRAGESDLALAGGVAVMLTPSLQVRSSRVGMLSPTGNSAPFDASADGIVLGEGVGVVVLKRLADARRDGDTIHGVIRASGMNGDGRTNGITAPSAAAQAELLRRVHHDAGVEPRDVTYIETHGTGTALGDPIEFNALVQVFGSAGIAPGHCGLGSIKGNFGHTTMAAGIAGLLKLLLALRYRQLPPTPGFTAPNPKVDAANSPFFFVDELRDWPAGASGRRVGAVSSFGFSGTNCHVVVAEPPPERARSIAARPEVVPLSARTEDELLALLRRLADALTPQHLLADIAFTLAVGRRHLGRRAAIVATSIDDLQAKLRALASGETPEGCFRGNGESGASAAPIDPGSDPVQWAVAYVGGRAVEWPSRFRGVTTRRVPLPAYPLAPTKHRVVPRASGERGAVDAPRRLDPDEPLIADHQIAGRRILAGAAAIELVVAASQRRGRRLPLRLGRVRWLRPLVIERPVTLEMSVDDVAYCIGARSQPHATGTIESIDGTTQHVDLPAVRARCHGEVDVDTLYRSFDAAGLRYGPSFRLLRRVERSGDTVLATFASPPSRERAAVPAAVLDGAFQAIAALIDIDDATPLVPVGARSVDVFMALDTAVHAVVRQRSREQYDIDITDAAGAVLVRVSGLALRPVGRAGASVLVPVWHPAPPPQQQRRAIRAAVIYRSRAKALADALSRALAAEESVLLPYDGNRGLDLSLLDAEWDTICFVAAADENAPEDDPSVAVLFAVVKRLLDAQRQNDVVTLKVVTDRAAAASAGEPVLPHTAALIGLTRTIATELPRWRVGCIDADARDPGDLAQRIAAEDCAERLVALRGDQRLVRAFEPASEAPRVALRFRHGGVYLILGGAGGIGFALSLHLARTAKARLVWIGRRAEDAEVRDRVAAVAAAGGEAIYLQADAAERAKLAAAVAEARRKFGRIDGAVHSAAVWRDRALANMTLADLEEVSRPKIAGSANLWAVLRDEPLDLFAFFSSAVSFVDSEGQGNYAAASTFEDAFAAHLRRTGVPATIVNWGYWGSVGAVANDHHRRLLAADGIGSLEPSDAFAAFERVCGVEQALIVDATPAGLAHFAAGASAARAPVDDREVRAYVRRVFAEVLKFGEDSLDDDSTFEQFGVDSVVGGEIVARFARDLGSLPATLLFEAMTIAELAKRLVRDRPNEVARALQPHQPPPRAATVSASAATSQLPQEPASSEDVAVIGLAGRYPGAPDLETFWRNLTAGVSSIREVPRERWDWRAAIDATQGVQGWQRWGGFIDGVDLFDAALFGVLPRDATRIDPQERLFLETCWSLLEQTGYLGLSLERSTGVFVGVMYGTWGEMAAELWREGELAGAHSAYWSIANRVSYTLDLHGPSFSVDSACSSSLTAVHLACESIRRGECRMAIAGGVNLILHPAHLASLGARRMLASDGVPKVFDSGANGYVPGEGVGAVLLKPLASAIADRDDVWAVIKGGALNAGGKTSGYTVPNPSAQAAVVEEALRRAAVAPPTIRYVEAHGTGTELGDPIEIAGLARAFGDANGHCAIGSVKSNIGHLEGAAGIAGLSKVLLQLRHRQLVPTVNLSTLNPKIELRGTPFVPQTSLVDWPSDGTPRRAGISSFGAGGANVHLIVEDAAGAPLERPSPSGEQLFLLSAPSRERLDAYSDAVADFLSCAPAELRLDDLAYTSQVGRRAFEARLAIAARSTGELALALRERTSREAADPETRALAARWLGGEPVDWRSLWPSPGRRVAFPPMPLDRKRYWLREPARTETPAAHLRYERNIWEPRPLRAATRNVRRVLLAVDDPAIERATERALQARGVMRVRDIAAAPDAIVYLAREPLHPAIATRPFEKVFGLAVERLRDAPKESLRLACASVGDAQPHLVALAGVVKTLAQEHATCSGVVVTIDGAAPEAVAARVVDELLRGDDFEVAYRDGVRMVRAQEVFEPGAAHTLDFADGTYLITGGAGALGLHFAGLLSRRGARSVVLAGRSPLRPDVAARIAALRGVRYERADVTRPQDVDRLVSLVRPLRGVIHAAGTIRDARAVDKKAEQLTAVIGPKIVGALHLDDATSHEPLDFFVLFSSVAGRTGNRGQADYAYANAFLDEFALLREQWRERGRRRGTTISIAWPLWRDGGMSVDAATEAYLESRYGMTPMSTDAGLDAFETLLASGEPAAMVIETRATPQTASAITTPPPAPERDSGAFAGRLAELAAEFLVVDPSEVDLHASLLDIGFDSISMADLIARVNEAYGLDLLPTVLFEHATLAELAGYLGRVAPSPRTAPPAAAPSPPRPVDDIAVIGMAGRFPASADLDELWRHLAAGDDLVRRVPDDREELLADERTRDVEGGFLDAVAEFDADLFGIAPAEAALMDPQQRLFLQVVWRAVADAGYRTADVDGSRTAVFAGVSTNDYDDLLTRRGAPVQAHVATGLSHAILANRVSHLFNLRGPSEAIDTACSSSLVAVHRAVQALRAGECDLAIAGGVSVALTPDLFVAFSDSGMLSPDGRCRTFDKDANGYVRGEGAGAILLKRLDHALADGDSIHAIIRGTAVNHGGRAASLTAPNPRAQAEVLRAAYLDAAVDPSSVAYVEAHGTGTPLGDPVEIEAIKTVVGAGAPASIAVGSIKTNIGHLEAAAGIAGLLKALLAIRHGQLPPHLHLREVNPHIRLAGTPLFINDALREWPEGRARRVGISSFGFGGTNAHVVVDAAPAVDERREGEGPLVFPISAPDSTRLAAYGRALAERLDSDPALDLHAVAYVLQLGRDAFDARFAVVTRDRSSLIAALREPLAGTCTGDGDADAAAWVGGTAVDWKARWTRYPRRVSLPSAPFARTRHWFGALPPIPAAATTTADELLDYREIIRLHVAETLGIPAASISGDRSFQALGLDSMFAMDIAERLTLAVGREVDAASLYDHGSVDELAAFLAGGESQTPQAVVRALLISVLGRTFDSAQSFTDAGFTSLDMLRAVSELERGLGPLPKTLLFDYPDLAALSAHLQTTFGDGPVRRLRVGDADAPPQVAEEAAATIVGKHDLAGSPRLATVISHLARTHGLESGLAGRDIAPLIFVASNESGYLEFARNRDALLVWSYTGPAAAFDDVLRELFAYARTQRLRVSVLSAVRLETVSGTECTATPFGVVQQIEDLAAFSLDAPKMGRLRGMVNRFARAGTCDVREIVPGSDPDLDRNLVNLVDRWADRKAVVNPYARTIREELRAGTLPRDHRVFVTSVDGVIHAAVIVTRMQSESGYLLDAEFYGSEMPMGGLDYSIVRIIDTLRSEGVKVFSFGATFGVRVCDSPNASAVAERALDELRSAGILGDGNYQFKRKFRPHELPIYLCQPADAPTDVAEVLVMIGSPQKVTPATEWDPLRLPHREIAIDLLTDSWAEREDAWIAERLRTLGDRQMQAPETIEQPWLPFPCVVPTVSGRAAEALLCRAWPGRRGVVLHNGLFPTWTFNLAEQRFTPVALEGLTGGDVPVGALADALERDAGRVSFIVIELSDNAGGGRPLSLANLKQIRAVTEAHEVPLLLDATRIIENAVFLSETEGLDPWSIVRELLALSDAATFSLSKDWGVNFGGMVASRLAPLTERLREESALRGTDVGLTNRRLLQAALSDGETVLTQVRERMAAVRALWQRLSDAGLPLLAPAGGHCVVLDVARIASFATAAQPVQAFVSWLYERSGIRGGPHLAAADAYPALQACCRLAVPVGMSVAAADRAGATIAALLQNGQPEEGWFTQQLRELGTTLQSDGYAPANQNLEVLREFVPGVDCRVVDIPEGEVEVFSGGAGPVLLLMQPFNIGAGMFAPQFAALSDRFRMIVIHQPGVGRTRANGSLSLDGVSRLQKRVLEELGIHEPIHVGGASVGAIFAQHFALTYPELTLSLTLMGGSYRFANRKGQIDKLEQVVAEDFDMIVEASGSVRVAEERERLTNMLLRCESMDPKTGLRYLDLFAKEPELAPRLGELRVPTLILQGRHDSVVGVKTGHFLHGAIPNARYVELASSGHFVCFTEPDAVNREIAAFLGEITAATYTQA